MADAGTFRMALVHELRAPLQVLQGHLDALWDDAGEVAGAIGASAPRERLGNMRSMLDVLAGAVDDVLSLGQDDVAQLPLREAVFEVRQSLDAEVDAFAELARRKGLDLTCEIADAVPVHLWGDGARLRQILRTLIDNALKYTVFGGVVVRVSWACAPMPSDEADAADLPDGDESLRAPHLSIRVTDTGPGIPAGMENAVFAAFSRGQTSVKGTGLGLWVARQWTWRLRGTLRAEPCASGARFRLSVPFALPGGGATAKAVDDLTAEGNAALPQAPARWPEREVVEVAVRPGLQALVVDDHVMNRRILADQLASLGCHVASAADLTDALVQWIALDVDVVLTDVHLDGVSGLALAKTLHALAPMLGRREPVVYAVTGSVVEARAAREAGLDGVLTKPVSRQRLSQTLAVRWPALEEEDDDLARDVTCRIGSDATSEVPPSLSQEKSLLKSRSPLRDDPYARRMMRDEMAKDLARFRRLLARRRREDLEAAQGLIHRMRGACRMFGDPALTERCDRLAERLANCRGAAQGSGDDG
ncbi:hybrid sensor histidine kinase/response regulator [Pandoraea sputorum]|uniref:ATP-binding response regulator n=1 Tax=Pandoraea sputorum TaxID=93222 RepID=UPI001E3CE88E|nr:hybrid sensor histidine kinase/response regulator [Pandoraea sputorum]MCE4059799.1 hybrid sensor histidine kinase/response regulator [Pandoraea sputorum]